jgi:phenylpyruvate tautomerase PptA (4-oxalocrotonate tautomerase family)
MFLPEGLANAEIKRALHDRVSRQVLEAEGATYEESELAQKITWMLIHEVPEDSWSVGSQLLSELPSASAPRVLTRIAVPHGSMTEKKRADIVGRVNEEVVSALGEELTDPTKSFCLIEEHTFSGGGKVVTFAQLVELLGLPELAEGDRSKEADVAVSA